MTADSGHIQCPHCGSRSAQKLISRFVRGRNEDQRIDAIADRLETMGEPESPTEMREMMREMGKAMDEDMSDEMEELLEEDLSGEGADDDGGVP
jgi:hypothetical protein